MSTKIPQIAIFYDWLNQWGGAEKVLLDIISIYPDAPVFTLVYDSSKTSWLPTTTKIITSKLNRLPYSKNNPIFYTPFYDLFLEQFDFSQYDIVISTTSTVGHCLLTKPNTLFVSYFHNINRYLYQTPKQYNFLKPILKLYQTIDKIESKRPDYCLCNSKTVFKRIQTNYQISPQILNPGIDTDFFKPIANPTKQYFLIVARLVPHKNIDLVIKAFKNLPFQLIIIGVGRYRKHLQRLAYSNSNIKFLGNVSPNDLLKYYQNCRALICPQLEDFGLTALEAQACGRPVIAFGRGGNIETIINYQTGIFFYKQTVKSLLKCISVFLTIKFSAKVCRNNSSNFSRQKFMLNFKQTIDNLWQKYQTTTY